MSDEILRLRAADKAAVGARVASESALDTVIVAIGDDRTDDGLFIALPSTHKVAVGQQPSRHAKDHRAVRRLLRGLVSGRVRVSS